MSSNFDTEPDVPGPDAIFNKPPIDYTGPCRRPCSPPCSPKSAPRVLADAAGSAAMVAKETSENERDRASDKEAECVSKSDGTDVQRCPSSYSPSTSATSSEVTIPNPKAVSSNLPIDYTRPRKRHYSPTPSPKSGPILINGDLESSFALPAVDQKLSPPVQSKGRASIRQPSDWDDKGFLKALWQYYMDTETPHAEAEKLIVTHELNYYGHRWREVVFGEKRAVDKRCDEVPAGDGRHQDRDKP